MSIPDQHGRAEELDRHLFNEGTHRYLHRRFGAQPADGGCDFAVWAPNASAVAVVGSFDNWEHEHELTGSDSGVWSGWVDGAAIGHSYIYRVTHVERCDGRQVRPGGRSHRGVAVDRVGDCGPDRTSGTTPSGCPRGENESHSMLQCRSTRCTSGRGDAHVTEGKRFPRTTTTWPTRSPTTCWRTGSRTSSCCRSWSTRSTGRGAIRPPASSLPSARYGSPQRPDGDDRPAAPARGGRDARLGAVALPHRPSRPVRVRRDASVRARRSAPGIPPRLELGDLQLRPQRGALVPGVERDVLARPVSRRRAAGGCRGVDAVPRLLTQRGRVDPERSTAGARISRRSRSCASSTKPCTASSPTSATLAEESTAWPMVSRPTYLGGLGFGGKWDMGWMHDTLEYLQRDPVHRRWHHGEITFRSVYAWERALRAAAEPRRGRARQGVAARQDAGRRLAAVREPPVAVRDAVGHSRARSCCSWVANWPPRTRVEPRSARRLVAPRRRDRIEGVRDWVAELNRLYASEPALHRGDSDHRPACSGWRPTMPSRACSPGCAVDPTGGARPVLVAINATPTPQRELPARRAGTGHAGSNS